MLAIYFVATLPIRSVLKSKLMLDVVVLAWLYTHRVLAGGIATGIPISAWLLAFSMFMFASLAFAKRYIELRQSLTKGGQLKSRGYHTQDLEMVASMGPAAGYIAVLVFCLYVDSAAVTRRLSHADAAVVHLPGAALLDQPHLVPGPPRADAGRPGEVRAHRSAQLGLWRLVTVIAACARFLPR